MNRTALFLILTLVAAPPFLHAGNEERTAAAIRSATHRAWSSYVSHAWGHDGYSPLSGKPYDWYKTSLGITLIDAYSTLSLMGFRDDATRIEHYVADTLSFDQDVDVKTFEVDIRILGGLLCMYQMSGNPAVLQKADDFGRRLLPAFKSQTGIPAYFVNLRTGAARGDSVNVAEGGSSLIEMGILSYYTGNQEYYQAAKRATLALFQRRSKIGLVAQDINIQTGKWLNSRSHIGACIDSYYEYLYKAWLLFGDPDLKDMWDASIGPVHKFLEYRDGKELWYGIADAYTGQQTGTTATLYDAYFPALLVLAGDLPRAQQYFASWDALWRKNGLEPSVYDFKSRTFVDPFYGLNPEIMESAYYLYKRTRDESYRRAARRYWDDLERYCRAGEAYTCIKDVRSKERADELPSFFFAETMKYLYLTFTNVPGYGFNDVIFSTEGHPFRKAAFDRTEVRKRLGF